MFIFPKKKTKIQIKIKKIFFIFILGRGPTGFDFAPTYLHQGWRISVT